MTAKEFLKEKGIHPTEPIYWDLENTTISLDELMQEYADKQLLIQRVSVSFEEGYAKGWREATSEACKEIAKNYTPNER